MRDQRGSFIAKPTHYEVASSTALTAVKIATFFSRTELKRGTRVEIEILHGPHRHRVLPNEDAAPKAAAKLVAVRFPCTQVVQFAGRLGSSITM
jgi:hypothetical protein